jgi:cob(I)alamin adenosyltransferase
MAIRIDRVYTRSGDDGTTGLVGGGRVRKDHPRIAAYGDVDELNSVLGQERAELEDPAYADNPDAQHLDRTLTFIQQELFDLGSELATPEEAEYEGMIRIGAANIMRLEEFIDALTPDLAPLKSFVLPGGGKAGATLHVARTVCRRAERVLTPLVASGAASVWTARYLNRLADLLFVQARWIAAKSRKPETLWQHGLEPPPRGEKRAPRAAKRKEK